MVVPFRTDGIIAKILWWMDERHLFVILPIIGILSSIGVFIWSGHRTMPEPEPININAERGDYCYIDVQFLTDWMLKVSDDSGNEVYYYLATDTGNNHYIVSMLESQFSNFSDIVEFTGGDSPSDVPAAQRADGIIKTLSFEEAETLAEVLGLTTDEFDDLFGKKFVDFSEDPDTIVVGAFIWVLGLSILILLLKGLAAFEEVSERRKERKRAMKRTE